MENHINVKNIFILFLFFLIGYISNIVITHWQEIDIYSLLSKLDDETEVEEIVVPEEEKEITNVKIDQEELVEEDLCPILVDISGAVSVPGVYCFEKGASVIDAVKKSRGFLPEAGFKYISMKMNLATIMLDNSKIYIPFETDSNCDLLAFSLPKEIVEITIPDTQPEQGEGDAQEGVEECISINEGSVEELETLEGVGPSTANKIIEGRPYSVLEDLLNVSGIGEVTFNKFKYSICL